MTGLTGKIREHLSSSHSPGKDMNQPSHEAASVDMDSKQLDKPSMEFKNELPTPPLYTESAQPATTETSSLSSHKMHVYMSDWKQRSMRIMSTQDSEDSPASMLYHIELHSTRSPNMTFRRPPPTTSTTATVSDVSSAPVLATANFHQLHTYIDIEINNHPFRFQPKSKWKMANYEYPSPAIDPGQTMTWTSPTPWVVVESTCLDAQQNEVARTTPVEWARKKAARIEFARDPAGMTQDELDEVVVTGMAFFYYRYLMQAVNASHS